MPKPRLVADVEALVGAVAAVGTWSLSKFIAVMLAFLSLLPFLKPAIKDDRFNSAWRTAALAAIALATGIPAEDLRLLFIWLRALQKTQKGQKPPIADMCVDVTEALQHLSKATRSAISRDIASVRLEYAGPVCVNPDCRGVGTEMLTKGGRDDSRPEVVTMSGILRGIQEYKYCGCCKARYCLTYYIYNDKHFYFTGQGRTLAVDHPYIRTHDNRYFSLDTLQMIHEMMYNFTASALAITQYYNSFCAPRAGAREHDTGTSGTAAFHTLPPNGEVIFKAWKLYRIMVSHLERQDVYVHDPAADLDHRAAARSEADRVREHGLPHAQHKCDIIGCNGAVRIYRSGISDNQPLGSYKDKPLAALVIDANCNLKRRCCGAVGCERDPINTKARFCKEHADLEDVCAFLVVPPKPGQAAQYCDEPCVDLPGGGARSKFCGTHLAVELRMCAQSYHRRASTRAQRTASRMASWQAGEEPSQADELIDAYAKHRATRAWTFGTVIIASPCGTILGTGSCRHGERVAPILGMVQRVVPELPHFLVYDRACFALRHLRNPNNDDDLVRELGSREALDRWRKKVTLVVDRFHQAGHSKTDVLCREYCNPFSVEHPVFTRVISKTPADEVLRSKCGREQVAFIAQMDAVLAHDSNGDVGVRWDVQVDGHEVRGRRIFRREGRGTGNGDGEQRLWMYEVVDLCNTEVCEQTFARIEAFGNIMREMESGTAEFYLHQMLSHHNRVVTASLEAGGKNPTLPADPWVDREACKPVPAVQSIPFPQVCGTAGTRTAWWDGI